MIKAEKIGHGPKINYRLGYKQWSSSSANQEGQNEYGYKR